MAGISARKPVKSQGPSVRHSSHRDRVALWHAPIVFLLARYCRLDNPWRLMLVQSIAVLVASIPFAHAYFLSRSIVPPMLFHFTWNIINPAVLGDIYQNQAGIVVGNMLCINGEALAGIIAGPVQRTGAAG